jgi:hypothetical protein
MNRCSLIITFVLFSTVNWAILGAAVAEDLSKAYFVSIPTRTLQSLLALTKIEHDGTPEGIRAATQKEQPLGWLCPAGLNRWQMEEPYAPLEQELKQHFADMKCVQEIRPFARRFTHLIIPAIKYAEYKRRVAFARELSEQGIQFDSVVMLCGQQPNHHTEITGLIEDGCPQEELPENQVGIARYLHRRLLNKELQELPVFFSDTPQKRVAGGRQVAPSLDDTTRTWLAAEELGRGGSALLISSQPFIAQHHNTFRKLLPRAIALETAGTAIAQDTSSAVVLDGLARSIYALTQSN